MSAMRQMTTATKEKTPSLWTLIRLGEHVDFPWLAIITSLVATLLAAFVYNYRYIFIESPSHY
jgi:hypothetical protein